MRLLWILANLVPYNETTADTLVLFFIQYGKLKDGKWEAKDSNFGKIE